MSQESYDYNSLFDPKIEVENSKKNTEEYSPSAEKGQGKVYKSLIRFVSWWENPNKSYIDKWVCFLIDPISERGRYIDCPSSIGKDSPLQNMFFKLRKSESVQEQKKAQIFSRRHSFAALVQVIKDDNAKDLEGKILVWRFGQKVYDKINAELNPVYGDIHNPFNLLNGKLFQVVITLVSGYNNYDQSKFIEKVVPLCMFNEKNKLIPINEKTDKKVVYEYLQKNSPDLKKYEYQEWTNEINEYVNHVIVATTGTTSSINYANVNESTRSDNLVGNKKSSGITSTELTIDDLNIEHGVSSLPPFDIPELPDMRGGISGDLDEALKGL